VSTHQGLCFWIFGVNVIIGLKPLMFPADGTPVAKFGDYVQYFISSFFVGILLILLFSGIHYLWIKLKKVFSN
jgi:hypothetical protein